MELDIIGRDEEFPVLKAFIRLADDGLRALVLEGAAGIGKSTLWLAGVSTAREAGIRVLTARPAEAEQRLAYAGVGDLLDDVLDEVLPKLPRPRRSALEVALLLAESPGDIDPRAVAVAMRSVLEVLAADGPVLLAVDDVQWLDPSSVAALAFVLRRVGAHPVRLLLTRRLEGDTSRELEDAIDAARIDRLRLDALSVGATQQLVHERLGRRFTRATVLRIHEASGGNPFYSLEIARALDRDIDPTRPLPIPETLDELVSARFDGLSGRTREALLLVAASGNASRALLQAAGVGADALEPAVAAQVVEWTNDSMRFTHPLLASALYGDARPVERTRVHRLLAEIVRDDIERGRHLALSVEGPDDVTAAAVDESASAALVRGAPLVASELWEHSLRLTPPAAEAERDRRTICAARAHLAGGNVPRARALAHGLLAATSPGPARAEGLVLLSDIEHSSNDLEPTVRLRREALREPSVPPRLQAEIHQSLSYEVRPTEGLAGAEVHVRKALQLAEQADDDATRAGALAALASLRFNAAKPDALSLARDAHELAVAAGDPEQRRTVTFSLGHVLAHSGRYEEASALFEGLYRELSQRDEFASADALWYLSLISLRTGRLSAAADYARQTIEIYRQYAIDQSEHAWGYWALSLATAHLGDLDHARELAERAEGPGVLGLVKFWQGELSDAVEHFEAAMKTFPGNREPALWWFCGDYIEALLELGRIDDAVELLDEWESNARRLQRSWVLAHATRCRGLVAAASGEVDQAQTLLGRAIDEHSAAEDPFGRGRALLALGLIRRRARQKRAAREAIEGAVQQFEELGAAGWAGKARTEVGRIGGRTREEGLSPAERRVAELVAEGRTNREVAAALFLGESTVETHLRHVYAKLGIRSRTDLARTLGSLS